MCSEIVGNVITQARLLATHSWEYGTLSEALLEWYNPEASVYSSNAFPQGKIPTLQVNRVESLSYAQEHIRINSTTLVDGDGEFEGFCLISFSSTYTITDRTTTC